MSNSNIKKKIDISKELPSEILKTYDFRPNLKPMQDDLFDKEVLYGS